MTSEQRTCRACDEVLPLPTNGRWKTYCSIRCKRRDQRAGLERTIACSTCGQGFTTRNPNAKYCSATCREPNVSKRCTRPGCDEPLRARGLCAKDWKQAYGKRAKTLASCEVCGTETEKDADTKRRSVCSDLCRAYLQHGVWPQCDIPKRHAARGYVRRTRPRLSTLERFISEDRSCSWCGSTFLAHRGDMVFCASTCKAKAKRVRRRGREHEADGTYTWTEVIHLFLAFDRCCAYCRQEIEGQPDPDHVVPLSKGGSNSITNILPSCRTCNGDKRDLLLHEWSLDRERRHLPPRITEWRRGDPLYTHLAVVQEHEHAA